MNKQILIIEDDIDDREILAESINKVDPAIQLEFSDNGLEAMQYLYGLKETKERLPGLIILDINLPYIDGMQTYQRLHADEVLHHIPIAIFTSSENPNDKELFERMGVLFISKPSNFKSMKEIVNRMLLLAEPQPTN